MLFLYFSAWWTSKGYDGKVVDGPDMPALITTSFSWQTQTLKVHYYFHLLIVFYNQKNVLQSNVVEYKVG